jgi:hypothetical protein
MVMAQTPIGLQLEHLTMLADAKEQRRRRKMSKRKHDFKHEFSHDDLREIGKRLQTIIEQQELTMSAFSDTQDSLTALGAAITAGFAALTTEITAVAASIGTAPGTGATDAQLVTLTTKVQAITGTVTTGLNAAVAQLVAAVSAVTPPAGAPVITTQPVSFTGSVAAGTSSATLTVATSDPAPTFQWFTGDPTVASPAPVAIPGATSATFTTPIQTSPSTISYFVAVTNATGTTNSVAVVVAIGA